MGKGRKTLVLVIAKLRKKYTLKALLNYTKLAKSTYYDALKKLSKEDKFFVFIIFYWKKLVYFVVSDKNLKEYRKCPSRRKLRISKRVQGLQKDFLVYR